jgi:hypothetical protein
MITEQHCLIEGKGKDRIVVRNFKHLIISSNEDWPVHLDPDDRRFLVLNVSEAKKEDQKYFGELDSELKNGGYAALLYDLLNEDLTNFNPRILPRCLASFGIKIRSADSIERYLYDVLCEGHFSIGFTPADARFIWKEPIPKDKAYKDYAEWCVKSGEKPATKELLRRAIKKLIPSVEDKRPGRGSRQRCYEFPSLKKAREEFSKAFKQDPKDIFDNYDEDEDEHQSREQSTIE